MAVEVHDQERKVVEDVDAGEVLAELDGVEQGGPAADEADVVEVQVAVATPHQAGIAAPVEQRRQALELRP